MRTCVCTESICHSDNYPFDYRSQSLATVNGDGGDIPGSVGLAAKVNDEKKPIWLCVQTFEVRPSL
jgi:hypothetical protein